MSERVALPLFLAFVTFVWGLFLGTNLEREKAIEANVGRWELVDETTQNTQFVYGVKNE